MPSFFDRPYARFALLATIAATAAYALASLFPAFADPAVAGITAVVSVRPTLHEAAIEAVRQVVGTLLGATIGLGLALAMGPSVLVLGLVILICFGIARLLRLGEEGGPVIALTVILVVGANFDATDVELRFTGVVLGVALALAASFFVRPGKPHTRALAKVEQAQHDTAELLTTIAAGVARYHSHIPVPVAEAWEREAERILRDIVVARDEAEAAATAARWYLLVDRKDAAAVLEQVDTAMIAARSTFSIAHDLKVTATRPGALQPAASSGLADLLQATAAVVTDAAGTTGSILDTQPLPFADRVSEAWDDEHDRTVAHLKQLDDTSSILITGSVLRDSARIARTVTREPGAPSVKGKRRKRSGRVNPASFDIS